MAIILISIIILKNDINDNNINNNNNEEYYIFFKLFFEHKLKGVVTFASPASFSVWLLSSLWYGMCKILYHTTYKYPTSQFCTITGMQVMKAEFDAQIFALYLDYTRYDVDYLLLLLLICWHFCHSLCDLQDIDREKM